MADKIHLHRNTKNGPPSPYRGHKSKAVKDQIFDAKPKNPEVRDEEDMEKNSGSLENMRFFKEKKSDVFAEESKDMDKPVHPFKHDSNIDYVTAEKTSEAVTKKFIAGFADKSNISSKYTTIDITIKFKEGLMDATMHEAQDGGSMMDSMGQNYKTKIADNIMTEIFGASWDQVWIPVQFELKEKQLTVTVQPR